MDIVLIFFSWEAAAIIFIFNFFLYEKMRRIQNKTKQIIKETRNKIWIL